MSYIRLMSLAAVLMFACTLVLGTGCVLETVATQIDPCSVINCGELGLDETPRANPFLPDGPDWDKDPTCTIPGYCGDTPYMINEIGTADNN